MGISIGGYDLGKAWDESVGVIVDERFVRTHNRYRLYVEEISKMIDFHDDYHYKPVWVPGDDKTLREIEGFRVQLNIPKNKTWLMPGGSTREELIPHYPGVIDKALEMGYNFCPRAHIIAFNDKRAV